MVEFYVDKKLKRKIELMIKRVQDGDNQDNYLIIEGDTGSGKTNCSVGIAHMVSNATGRPFDVNHIFFDMNEAIKFATTTSHQIIIFDEPALGGLKADWRNKVQQDLIKLIFTSRKKRHFVIFNLVKFSKFNDDIVEKSMAIIRVFKRNETLKQRSFLYIPHIKIEPLLDFYRRKHKRAYYKFAILRGTLWPYNMDKIIDMEKYEEMKDKGIMSITETPSKADKETRLQLKIVNGWKELKKLYPDISIKNYCKSLGISTGTTSKWANKGIKEGISLENDTQEVKIPASIIDKEFDELISLEREAGEPSNIYVDNYSINNSTMDNTIIDLYNSTT